MAVAIRAPICGMVFDTPGAVVCRHSCSGFPDLSNGSTHLFGFTGRYQAVNTNENAVTLLSRGVGRLRNLLVDLPVNGAGNTPIIRSRKGGFNGNLIVSYADGEVGEKEDVTREDVIAVGDQINLSWASQNVAPASTPQIIAVDWIGATGYHAIYSALANIGSVAGGATRYCAFTGGRTTMNATESQVAADIGVACTVSGLQVYVLENFATTSGTVTLRKNGVNTALVATITPDGDGFRYEDNNIAHAVTFAATDEVDYKISPGNDSLVCTLISCWVVPTSSVKVKVLGGNILGGKIGPS